MGQPKPKILKKKNGKPIMDAVNCHDAMVMAGAIPEMVDAAIKPQITHKQMAVATVTEKKCCYGGAITVM